MTLGAFLGDSRCLDGELDRKAGFERKGLNESVREERREIRTRRKSGFIEKEGREIPA